MREKTFARLNSIKDFANTSTASADNCKLAVNRMELGVDPCDQNRRKIAATARRRSRLNGAVEDQQLVSGRANYCQAAIGEKADPGWRSLLL